MPSRVLADGERLPGVREDADGFSLLAPDGTAYRAELISGVLSPENPALARAIGGRRVVAFTGPTVGGLYGEALRHYLEARLAPGTWTLHTVPTGERNKTLAAAERVCALAKADGLDRHGVMLALGGGIVADVVGFAASMYARGVRHVRINTTLVGQVDVGVGVKTGVNALRTKNMFGAYHPSHASLSDPAFLATLPVREVRCGLAEIVKMAVILDEGLFATLERYPDAFRSGGVPTPPEVETYVLRTSMRLMMEELCPNLREKELARLVDFGHTFSPVIETAGDHRLEHGEAVSVDMALSACLALRLGLLDEASCERIVALLARIGLPVLDAATCVPELMTRALEESWERRGRRLHLVVPAAVGKAVFVDELADVPAGVLRDALADLARRAERLGAEGVRG
ncbi:sedoheptulose 7-phosphate cyclase [Streptomyces termitum]|uniref:2-epi-5-epi-valiolone synthase n=1 Tax=Streptomyces termitum TaxID=67368 RepID=A0A918T872_9ACTN|nr:sedoheptulose 7-phosphate cyclase [Streptomyces termitum]GHA90351.1 3-dehydroquinate synthase [Streptomyces termitum]